MRKRMVIAGAVGAVCVVLAVVLHRVGPGLGGFSPGCVFRQTTGFYCAGCGMTRAAYHLLHLEPAKAFRMNPLMVLLLPVIIAGISLEVLAWVRGPERPTPRLRPGWKTTVVLVTVILLYGVVRNFPWWPFTLLAPHCRRK
jgi:hypothetical protein